MSESRKPFVFTFHVAGKSPVVREVDVPPGRPGWLLLLEKLRLANVWAHGHADRKVTVYGPGLPLMPTQRAHSWAKAQAKSHGKGRFVGQDPEDNLPVPPVKVARSRNGINWGVPRVVEDGLLYPGFESAWARAKLNADFVREQLED